jgi:hypothetical protein
MNATKVIVAEDKSSNLITKIINAKSKQEESKNEVENDGYNLETYQSSASNTLAINSAAEGYVEDIIQKHDIRSPSIKKVSAKF